MLSLFHGSNMQFDVPSLAMGRSRRDVAGGLHHDFDMVTGPVANDNTMRTITLYVDGIYDCDEAMRRLTYFRPNDQVSLHTPEAMGRLRLKERNRV